MRTAIFAALIAVSALGTQTSNPAEAGIRACKNVTGFAFGATRAEATYSSDRVLKRRMQPWRAKGYNSLGTYERSCQRRTYNGIRGFWCKDVMQMCKYRS